MKKTPIRFHLRPLYLQSDRSGQEPRTVKKKKVREEKSRKGDAGKNPENKVQLWYSGKAKRGLAAKMRKASRSSSGETESVELDPENNMYQEKGQEGEGSIEFRKRNRWTTDISQTGNKR